MSYSIFPNTAERDEDDEEGRKCFIKMFNLNETTVLLRLTKPKTETFPLIETKL